MSKVQLTPSPKKSLSLILCIVFLAAVVLAVVGFVGKNAALQQHSLARISGGQADAAFETEGAMIGGALAKAGEQVAGHFLQPPEWLVLARSNRQIPAGLVGQIHVGQFRRSAADIGFDAVAEAAWDGAVDAELRAAHANRRAQIVGRDGV